MKTISLIVLALALGAGIAIGADLAGEATPDSAFQPAKAAVFFSPKGGCEAAVVREIGAAKSRIAVQAYSFTSPAIVSALKGAHDRGVVVAVLLDKSNLTGKYSGASYLLNAGLPVGIDPMHAIAHNKIIIIDPDLPRATVLTGSFNFSRAAESSNAENLVILRECPELVKAYIESWKAHGTHSYPLVPLASATPLPTPPTEAD